MPDDILIYSNPVAARLSVEGQAITADRRREWKEQLDAGELDHIEFDAVAFVAEYPNRNAYRFRDGDLETFAASYAGQPFLRNHDTRRIESRDGTIQASRLDGIDFVQTIRLTTERGMRSFVEGQIDRFSIGWYFEDITCSICGDRWLSRGCFHWPRRHYEVDGEDVLCELIFEEPRGKETSAVNAPAVDGTQVLAQLCAQKEALFHETDPPLSTRSPIHTVSQKGPIMPDTVDETQIVAPEAAAPDDAEQPAAAAGVEEWFAAIRDQGVETLLQTSGLPAAARQSVRDRFAGREDYTPAQVQEAIDRQKELVADLTDDVVHGLDAPIDGGVTVGAGSLERIEEALTALIEGRQPANGVRPLSGIREAYVLLSGDHDMRGMFQPDNVQLAAVDSSTMAGIVANAMNKVVVNQFQTYPRWWEPIVTPEDFASLQDARWITLGGVGELPTVSEGGSYGELDWDDQTETDAFVKKGGYLGLTLEAVDKDDTTRLRQAPRALAQAAWLTLGKSIARIFTMNSGAGPVMSDGNNLFDSANHNNLGSSALAWSAWDSTKTAMKKQTEINSGERLGALTAPRYLLVPTDLETTAVQVLASEGEPGTADNDENPFAEGDTHDMRMRNARRRVVEVPFWTDAKDWAAVADPNMYPSIGLGFRFGRTPEIFSVASPNSGLMFTNDVMPIKVRFFFATGPTDWRGLYKHNV